MGNENSTSPKRLFEQLDKTKDGVLTLDDLLTLGKIDERRPFTQSPLLLFRFDDGADGALNKEEFQKYLRHLQKSEKQRDDDKKKKQKEEKKKTTDKRKKDGEATDSFSQPWLTIDKKTADKMKLSRDTETPCFIGTGSPTASPNLTEYRSQHHGNIPFSEETKSFLNQLLSRSEWRKQFMAWLFRLADVDKDGDLDVKELELILKALENDGIHTKDLSFHQTEGSVAQSLLEEYNTGKTGSLTREEFMSLADLILRHYEARSATRGLHTIGKYELKRKLGSGSYSVVRLGVNRETGERKAIKIIKRGDVSDMSRVDVELKAMMMLDHPSIVKLDEVLENEEHVFFVMELCGGGSLSNYLERKPLSEPLARYYMPQLLSGLAYCHSKGVCHRDLKLENLVIDNSGHLNITDFGHAGIYRKGWDLFSTGLVGSLYHVSPEQIAGQCYSGEKIDIWGVGIILYRLLTGNPPFYSPNTQEMFDAISNVRYQLPDHLSPEAKDLLQLILKANPDERPSCKAILKHPWFKGPVKQPAMAYFVLKLESKLTPEAVWKEICNALTALNIHVLKDITSKYHCLHMVKCVDPKRDIKFSVSMKETKTPGQPPIVEFNLKEGEAWDFNQTVYKIRSSYRRWKRQQLEMLNRGEPTTNEPVPGSMVEKKNPASPLAVRKKSSDKKSVPSTPSQSDKRSLVQLDDSSSSNKQSKADATPAKPSKMQPDKKPKGRDRLKAASDGIQSGLKTKSRPSGKEGSDSSSSSSSSSSSGSSSSDSESGETPAKPRQRGGQKNEKDGQETDSDGEGGGSSETGEQEQEPSSQRVADESDSENNTSSSSSSTSSDDGKGDQRNRRKRPMGSSPEEREEEPQQERGRKSQARHREADVSSSSSSSSDGEEEAERKHERKEEKKKEDEEEKRKADDIRAREERRKEKEARKKREKEEKELEERKKEDEKRKEKEAEKRREEERKRSKEEKRKREDKKKEEESYRNPKKARKSSRSDKNIHSDQEDGDKIAPGDDNSSTDTSSSSSSSEEEGERHKGGKKQRQPSKPESDSDSDTGEDAAPAAKSTAKSRKQSKGGKGSPDSSAEDTSPDEGESNRNIHQKQDSKIKKHRREKSEGGQDDKKEREKDKKKREERTSTKKISIDKKSEPNAEDGEVSTRKSSSSKDVKGAAEEDNLSKKSQQKEKKKPSTTHSDGEGSDRGEEESKTRKLKQSIDKLLGTDSIGNSATAQKGRRHKRRMSTDSSSSSSSDSSHSDGEGWMGRYSFRRKRLRTLSKDPASNDRLEQLKRRPKKLASSVDAEQLAKARKAEKTKYHSDEEVDLLLIKSKRLRNEEGSPKKEEREKKDEKEKKEREEDERREKKDREERKDREENERKEKEKKERKDRKEREKRENEKRDKEKKERKEKEEREERKESEKREKEKKEKKEKDREEREEKDRKEKEKKQREKEKNKEEKEKERENDRREKEKKEKREKEEKEEKEKKENERKEKEKREKKEREREREREKEKEKEKKERKKEKELEDIIEDRERVSREKREERTSISKDEKASSVEERKERTSGKLERGNNNNDEGRKEKGSLIKDDKQSSKESGLGERVAKRVHYAESVHSDGDEQGAEGGDDMDRQTEGEEGFADDEGDSEAESELTHGLCSEEEDTREKAESAKRKGGKKKSLTKSDTEEGNDADDEDDDMPKAERTSVTPLPASSAPLPSGGGGAAATATATDATGNGLGSEIAPSSKKEPSQRRKDEDQAIAVSGLGQGGGAGSEPSTTSDVLLSEDPQKKEDALFEHSEETDDDDSFELSETEEQLQKRKLKKKGVVNI